MASHWTPRHHGERLQRRRLLVRAGFFVLFVLAPPLNLFRLDLHLGHFIIFGVDWTLGLEAFRNGEIGPGQATLNLLLRGFLPIIGGGALFLGIAWRYGRLYCGWLCPHFSVVEIINTLLRRASGKPTVWERIAAPRRRPDGGIEPRGALWWLLVLPAMVGFAILWAVVLLTYLLPPAEIYANLLNLQPTRNQATFLIAATTFFLIDFSIARHLFCRFGCAVGLFQSYIWMANRRGMVVGFDRTRAATCATCNDACEHACPMRLKPRASKRHIFSCTQCARCIQACSDVQRDNPQGTLLGWVRDACAEDTAWGGFGKRPVCTDTDCHLQHGVAGRPVQVTPFRQHRGTGATSTGSESTGEPDTTALSKAGRKPRRDSPPE